MDLGTVLASAWSAGISLYGVTALLGIAGRIGWLDVAPFLEHPATIATAVALFVVELVVDKVAVLDTVWDAAHTVIRPVGASALSVLAPDQDLSGPVLALTGGGLALSSHAAKAATRSLVNASPEPASNVVVSVLEDGAVAALMALAIAYPVAAGVVALLLGVASTVVAVIAFRASRRAWRGLRRRLDRWAPPRGSPPGAGPQ